MADSEHSVSLDDPITTRSPLQPALSEAETAEQRRNVETVDRFLDLLQAERIDDFMSLWADETRQDNPYAPPGFPPSYVTKERVSQQYHGLPGTFEYMRYTDREIFVTQDPRVVIARFKGDIKLKGKDTKYDNRYFNVFVFDANGRIVRDIEHFNPLVLIEGGAFGEGGQPVGDTATHAPSADRGAWARDFFAAVDSGDADRIASRMTEDARLAFGVQPPVTGRDAIRQAFEEVGQRVSRTRHAITGVWSGRDGNHEVVSVEAAVTYGLHDEREVVVPCTSTLRLDGELVADYRIFIDPAPVFGSTDPANPADARS